MKYPLYGLLAAGVVGIMAVTTLRADSPASIEITGVKLNAINQITVETIITNLSNKNISLDPRIWGRMASLKGEYFDDPNVYIPPETLRVVLNIYGNLGGLRGNYFYAAPSAAGGSYPPPPLIVKSGEKTKLSVNINMHEWLQADFFSVVDSDLWMRVGLYQPGKKDNQYSMDAVAVGNLYKLERPIEGHNRMRLEILKPSF